MRTIYYLLLTLIILICGCSQPGTEGWGDPSSITENPVKVSGTRFIDSYGRQVILSGVNKVNKNQQMNYTDKDSLGSYSHLADLGFNVIRLGIIWDGVEPEPGKFDEKYLDKIEERVKWAESNGIYVLLDMHQDLYSVLYSDGAPVWATLSENQPHVKGDVWSDSYFLSPAVQKAFDSFWANSPAPDGSGLQDHYAKMWKHIASRFANSKAVLGYDIMNEPFNGSQGNEVLPVILNGYAQLFAEETGKVLTPQELGEIWASEEKRFEALGRMKSSEKYSRVLDAATESCQQFEKNTLQPMYQKMSDAIREVDTTHILFLEHSYFGNTGIRSGIEPVKRKNGKTDPLVAYGPHGYDLLVDTKNYDSQSNERVGLIFNRMKETSERMNVPVLVGEWGAFSGNSESMAMNARYITGLIENLGFSNTYWAYYSGIESDLYFKSAIVRPFPHYTAGVLTSCSYDPATGNFTCSWDEAPEIKAPTVIFIPDLSSLDKKNIVITQGGSGSPEFRTSGKGRSGYVIIPVTGKQVSRTLTMKITSN